MSKTQRREPNRTATRKPIDPVMHAHLRLSRAHLNATTYPSTTAISSYVEVRDAAEQAIVAAVERAKYDGASWADIGEALGISPQGAQQRYGRIINR